MAFILSKRTVSGIHKSPWPQHLAIRKLVSLKPGSAWGRSHPQVGACRPFQSCPCLPAQPQALPAQGHIRLVQRSISRAEAPAVSALSFLPAPAWSLLPAPSSTAIHQDPALVSPLEPQAGWHSVWACFQLLYPYFYQLLFYCCHCCPIWPLPWYGTHHVSIAMVSGSDCSLASELPRTGLDG